MVTQADRDRAKAEERFKAELDARSFKPVMMEEGRRDGKLIGRINLCQNLLRQPQSSQDELLALPFEKLQQLADRFEQQAFSNLRPANGTPEPGPTNS